MRKKNNTEEVIGILDIFTYFLDKAEHYLYLPGDLKMVINCFDDKITWSVIKNPYIDALAPQRMFFEVASEDLDEKLYIEDHNLRLKILLEDVFELNINEEDEIIALENWLDRSKLEKIRESHPKLYQVIKNRLETIKQVSEKYKIIIKNNIGKESRHTWLEIEIRSHNMHNKDKVRKTFDLIEILREVYKKMLNVTDEEQKYYTKDKEQLINQLRIHISQLYKILNAASKNVFWRHVGVFAWPGFDGIGITLQLKTEYIERIFIHAVRETDETVPYKYRMLMTITASKEQIKKITKKLNIKTEDDNSIGIKRTFKDLTQLTTNITNLLKQTTTQP